MGQHWSHLTPTKRIQLDAFIRAGMKPTDIAKELGVHHTTIYRELKRCTYEHLNSDYTTETRYNPEGAQARYEANLRAKGPELKIGNDYELADYLIAKIRDEKYSPEAAIGEAEVKGWPFKTHICASTAYNYIRGEIFGDELTVSMLPQHGKRHQPERWRTGSATSKRAIPPTRSCSMKSAKSTPKCRSSCCACSRPAVSSGSETMPSANSPAKSSPRPTATSPGRAARACSVTTFITGCAAT